MLVIVSGFLSSIRRLLTDGSFGIAVSALMVGLDMIQSWKITKQWSVDLTLITDGNLILFDVHTSSLI